MAERDYDFTVCSPAKRFRAGLDHEDTSEKGDFNPGSSISKVDNCENFQKGANEMCSSEEIYTGADSGFSEISLAPQTLSSSSEEISDNNKFFPEKESKIIDGKDFTEQIDDGNIQNDFLSEDDEDDEVASTVSNLSGLSDTSDVSGQGWKPCGGLLSVIQKHMLRGTDPRAVLSELIPSGSSIPNDIDPLSLWRLIINILCKPPCRKKLPDVNTLTDVVNLIKSSQRIVVLTGAGVSVSCGIPDFRSRDGLYARLSKDYPDLPDPQAMFDIRYFRKNPHPFFKFAKEIYPGQFKPSIAHKFIKSIEKHKKLLRNYTQNIDTLEQVAGIESVIQCHGSFATASCTRCKTKVDSSVIKDEIFEQRLPYCTKCINPEGCEETFLTPAIMKPDIVFFGEGLSEEFHDSMTDDKDKCDLLIVIGSSLKVQPVALIPNSIPSDVPQILINREPLKHMNFDVELMGDSDIIINEIALRLGESWSEICANKTSLTEIEFDSASHKNLHDDVNHACDMNSHSETEVAPDSTCNPELVTCSCLSANKFPEKSFIFQPPSRYVFQGAEIENLLNAEVEDNVNAIELSEDFEGIIKDNNVESGPSDEHVPCSSFTSNEITETTQENNIEAVAENILSMRTVKF